MTLSIWRLSHLALALIASVFLILLSVTGIILAVGAIDEKNQGYKVENFEKLNLAQTLPVMSEVFSEITELKVDHRNFVSIEALDLEGNTVKGYINPEDGQFLGEIIPQNAFIQWNTNLHRSLFLKETGRIIIGLASFFLFLIAITGALLIVKRQQGLRNFFAKINREYFEQYFHVVSGRIALIPILIIAATGAYLSIYGVGILKHNEEHSTYDNLLTEKKEWKDFEIFKEIKLSEVQKIEFPFIPDDPDEYFILKLKNREIKVNQVTGQVVDEVLFSNTYSLERLSLDLHTGRTNILWAIILGFACVNILFFIYSGFVITFKRKAPKLKNTFSREEAEVLIVIGSENGSTTHFAYQVFQQLLAQNQKVYIAEMNQFMGFPKLKKLIVFTSTYGLGTAPSNAHLFENLIENFNQDIEFSIVGFGSKAYPDYCAFAYEVDRKLREKSNFRALTEIYTVNDKSVDDFISWVNAFNETTSLNIATTPALYKGKVVNLKSFKIIHKTEVSEENATFIVSIKPLFTSKYQSGDLLAIYPANDARERLYSIGKTDGLIQLVVKFHENGLGSQYLNNLKVGDTLKAKLLENASFHLPKNCKEIAMIGNGTGIAPFLGMVEENNNVAISLYAGFKYNNSLVQLYAKTLDKKIKNNQLERYQFAFSRENSKQYVMDLILKDQVYFQKLLKNGGLVMICGSLQMYQDVFSILKTIYPDLNPQQILSDCY